MKRSAPMQRTPMKRSSFKREQRGQIRLRDNEEGLPDIEQPQPRKPKGPPRGVLTRVDDVVRAQVKDMPLRSEPYRRLVASLPCICCGIGGSSQAAHPNSAKGMGTKADDRLCFPLCADRPGVRGCHSKFDQGAMLTKEERKAAELKWGKDTRDVIRRVGLWPDGLPAWTADDEAANEAVFFERGASQAGAAV